MKDNRERASKVESVNLTKLRAAWHLVKSGAKSGAFAGAVGLISKNGNIVFHESCGFASIYPSKILMQRNSIFDLASVTKAVATTTAVMLLVQRGVIGLDEKASSILSGFGNSNWKKLITVEHLLTHCSGLPAWRDLYTHRKNRDSIINEICHDVDSIVKPGSSFNYSDIGFIILGRLVEEVSGKTLDSFVAREIFSPLRMKDTYYNPESKSGRLVSTEYSNWRGEFVRGKVHDENAYAMDGISGHAGLFSSAEDLAKFCQQLLDHDEGILSGPTVRLMTSDHTSHLGGHVGLGWWIRTKSTPNIGSKLSARSFGHNGYTGTSVWIDPKNKLSIILLTNRIHPVREGDPENDRSVGIMMSRKSSWGKVNRAFHDAVIDSIES